MSRGRSASVEKRAGGRGAPGLRLGFLPGRRNWSRDRPRRQPRANLDQGLGEGGPGGKARPKFFETVSDLAPGGGGQIDLKYGAALFLQELALCAPALATARKNGSAAWSRAAGGHARRARTSLGVPKRSPGLCRPNMSREAYGLPERPR